jgi:hypothetical protein
MKGSNLFTAKDAEGHNITSIDGYRGYLIVVDRKSRYTWVFVMKSKAPPLNVMDTFPQKHGNQTVQQKTLRTDEGGDLWGSEDIKTLALKHGYCMELTAPGTPFQNGLAERPNQTFGNMVRCLIHSVNLGPEY